MIPPQLIKYGLWFVGACAAIIYICGLFDFLNMCRRPYGELDRDEIIGAIFWPTHFIVGFLGLLIDMINDGLIPFICTLFFGYKYKKTAMYKYINDYSKKL